MPVDLEVVDREEVQVVQEELHLHQGRATQEANLQQDREPEVEVEVLVELA
jgi:hypothetical protein